MTATRITARASRSRRSTRCIVESYALREDSGGAGKHRGGLGTEQVVRALDEISFNAQIERVDCRPWGLFGGLSALGNEVQLKRNGEDIRFPTGKVLAQFLKKGDVYTLRSGGGGGCGTPLDRKLDDVENDVRQGYVSVEAAHQFYGVEFNADGRADRARSEALRRDMRRRGLPKDRPVRARGFLAPRLPALRLPDARSSRRADDARGRRRGSRQLPLLLRPTRCRKHLLSHRNTVSERPQEDTIVSVERAFEIVAMLADLEEGASLADIARHLDVNKAIAVKLLATLERLGIAWRDDVAQRYNLTYRISNLGLRQLQKTRLARPVRSSVERARRRDR